MDVKTTAISLIFHSSEDSMSFKKKIDKTKD